MQYLAAYALSSLSGKEPSKLYLNLASESITAIVTATGQKADANEVKKVIEALKNKKIEEVILIII
jgi:ribosomal protein L12E/L44/L45/RPP1/RPP2